MRAMRHVGSWGLALFLIFMFVQATIHPLPDPPAGSVKLFDAAGENIVFATIAAKTGFALAEPTGRFLVAIAELLLAGAVAAHLLPDVLGREVPLSLVAGETATDGGRLFALAIAMLAASMLLIVVHPGKRVD